MNDETHDLHRSGDRSPPVATRGPLRGTRPRARGARQGARPSGAGRDPAQAHLGWRMHLRCHRLRPAAGAGHRLPTPQGPEARRPDPRRGGRTAGLLLHRPGGDPPAQDTDPGTLTLRRRFPMSELKEDVRETVREKYGAIASTGQCCETGPGCGCGCQSPDVLTELGYTAEQQAAVPEGASLGLGCGNPLAHAAVAAGETVLDLGSGAGIDCFLAAREAGPGGHVIGVDMTPLMIKKT